MDLIRAGVQKLKVIDYDLVTLSSLNRHSFAKRSDVGKFKSDLIKEYCTKARPDIIIESIDKPLLKENLEKFLLPEKPDVIIDCIDDLNTKAELFKFCFLKKIKIFSSMGAGAKCDPTTIRFGKFNEIQGEILSRRLRYLVRKKMKEEGLIKLEEKSLEMKQISEPIYSRYNAWKQLREYYKKMESLITEKLLFYTDLEDKIKKGERKDISLEDLINIQQLIQIRKTKVI